MCLSLALFKTPNSTYSVGVVLVVVLVPRVVTIVLRRTPVVVISKTTHNVL